MLIFLPLEPHLIMVTNLFVGERLSLPIFPASSCALLRILLTFVSNSSLLGRPVFTNRDKWQYYTMSDQNNSVKLPVSQNGKSCTNEYGCNRLYDGDTVYVEGFNDIFRVTVYDNNVMEYIPYL